MGKTEEEIKKEKRRKYLNEKMKGYEWYCGVCKMEKITPLSATMIKFSKSVFLHFRTQ